MKILVIGSGGREHALIKSFKKSNRVEKIYVLPGNDGLSMDAELITADVKNFTTISNFCTENKINFVFIGPEEPLVQGLTDHLRKNDIFCIGPSKAAAQLEGSKIFAKEFMKRAGVPTADAHVVNDLNACMLRSEHLRPPYILKADGLAAGKGVFICETENELWQAAQDLFENKILGDAGSKALLEKNLPGWELSYLILTNGEKYECLPLAQDHKRLKEQNSGPNTGGMGTVAPLKISDELNKKIIEKIIAPSVAQLKKEKLLYYGVLFVGIMVVQNEPYALEYNTRFGDPETQVILPLIENDTTELFYNLSQGKLDTVILNGKASVCIVNAAQGYPHAPIKGATVIYDDAIAENILFAGVRKEGNSLVTNGGRVLNVVVTDTTIENALKKAYALNKKVDFHGRQFRTDIGKDSKGDALA